MEVGYWCVIIPVLMIVAVFVKIAIDRGKAQSEREAIAYARQAYQKALDRLKQAPHDPSLKQTALALGREYSNLSRNSKGVTIFDEMALMNDLNAATAAAHHIAPTAPTAPAAAASPSVADRLQGLDGLKAKGLINDEEYTARRAKILDEL